jgi:hypothetical protein
MSADAQVWLHGFMTGAALVAVLAGWPASRRGNGDSKPSTDGGKTAKQKWWLR